MLDDESKLYKGFFFLTKIEDGQKLCDWGQRKESTTILGFDLNGLA